MKAAEPFSIVYEDKDIIAVNKMPGISVGGSRWDQSLPRLDKLVAGKALNSDKIFTVHRIDRETSGLVVFAKNEDAHRKLSAAFDEKKVKKRYIAIVHGRPLWKDTVCDLPLLPDGNKLHHTIIDKYQGKKSVTVFRLLCSAGNFSVLEALPETGRTHQIRVHAAALGHLVVCDAIYGKETPVFLSAFKKGWRGDPLKEKPLLARLGLHAAEICLPKEIIGTAAVGTEEMLKIQIPLPRDMAALVKQMEKEGGKAVSVAI